jgi:hypothetical protein
MKCLFALALYAAWAVQAPLHAQSPVTTSTPAADDSGLFYTSAFEAYQRFQDAPASSWQQTNQTVNRIGGWRAYARQAQEQQAPAASTPAPSPAAPPVPAQEHHHAPAHTHHGAKP